MRKLSLGLVLLFMLQLGASAPQSSSTPKPVPSAPKAKGPSGKLPAMTPQSVGDEIVKFFGRKTGKELMAEKAGNVAGAGAAAAKAITTRSSVKGPVATAPKPGRIPPPPVPRTDVPQIRLEIQKIIELNKKIQSVQSGRSMQLQRVQEQARIHQKILNELEVSQKQAAVQKIPEKSALLAQEKLRIIHEETQRNFQAIEKLQSVPAKTVVKEAPQTVAAAGSAQPVATTASPADTKAAPGTDVKVKTSAS